MNDKTKGASLDLFSMLHVAHEAEDEVEAKLNEIGLSLTKLMALKALDEAGAPVPLGQLADRLSCVKSNITQLVDRLEADGLVARKPDPRDRRTTLAALTTAGRRACRQAIGMQQETEHRISSRLTRAEALHFGALVAKVARRAK